MLCAVFFAAVVGQVFFNGLPVPGATVTATKAAAKAETITDMQGNYSLPDLADGTWTIAVNMLGFAASLQEVAVGPTTPPVKFELRMLPLDQVKAEVPAGAS
jgi:hypothetical protein